MSSVDSVGQNTQDSFGSYRLAKVGPFTMNASVLQTIPILGGGMTPNSGGYVVRRVTITNQTSQNTALGNITICTTSDGNLLNAVTSNTLVSSLTGLNTFQDFTITSTANTTIQTASALFANITTAVANSNVIVSVYGDVISF